MPNKVRKFEPRRPAARLDTPTDLSDAAVREISKALNRILADAFALYLKTKNFHWHVSGPHFRDYHLLLDEQAEQIFGTTDELAERVRKIGGLTLRSIGDIAKHQSIRDNNEDFVEPVEMLRELMNDNKAVAKAMREAHELCASTRMPPPRACSRSGSTKPSGASGSSTKRAGGRNRAGISPFAATVAV